jgi:hypothetical protein
MERVVLKYNPENVVAKNTLDYLLSLGVFEVEKSKPTSFDEALDDIKNGRVYTLCSRKSKVKQSV